MNELKIQPTEIELWPNEIPNSIQNDNYEEVKFYENSILVKVSQVKTPTLTLFKPKNPNGTLIIICPGGSYTTLSIDKEGFKVAEWLNTIGITAIVLKYRLPSDEIMEDKAFGPLQDAQEAIRYARRNSKNWNLNENKIGFIGFSAGGHLASTLASHYDDLIYKPTDSISAKPDFTILIYPVISMDKKNTHKKSKKCLLGKNPSNKLIEKYSNEKNVDSLTSPVFIVHASNDKPVPVENSLNYYLALKNKNVQAEMHIYEKGGHGFGLGKSGTSKFWTKDCEIWLRTNKYLN
jgi:acetyl esterase/lipase